MSNMNIIYTIGTHNTVRNVATTTLAFEDALASVIATHNASPAEVQRNGNNFAMVLIGEDVMKVVCDPTTDVAQDFIAELN